MTPHTYMMGRYQRLQKTILRIGIQQTLTPNVKSFAILVVIETRKLYLVTLNFSFLLKDFYAMYKTLQMMNRGEHIGERDLLHH